MSRENVEVVRRALDAFNAQDADALVALWTPDAEWMPAFIGGGILEGAIYRGHEGIIEFVEIQAETWATVTATPLATRELGDRVLVDIRLDAVGKASGIPVEELTWNVFELSKGLLSRGRVYLTEEEALGAFAGG
jgi:ketosteroid isomerase-like protein